MHWIVWSGLAALMIASPALALAKAPSVVILGSSSVNGSLGRMVEHELKERGYEVKRNGKSSSGFSRPDFYDWQAEAKKIKSLSSADAAVVYMGVNDGQSIWLRPSERTQKGPDGKWIYFNKSADWKKAYSERVQTFVQGLCDRGMDKVVVLTPMDVVNKKLQRRLGTIRKLQAEAAKNTTCGTSVATDGDDWHIKNDKKLRKSWRSEDGSHATITGAKRIWKRIKTDLFASLPPAPAPAPEAGQR